MKTPLTAIALAAILVTAAIAGSEADLEKRLDDPPATGLLVITIGDETPAKKAGMARGDVLVSYGGIALTDVESLVKAKAAKASEESVEIRAGRGDWT